MSALAALLRTRQVSSVELTKLYLSRLRKYDPALKCVITYTDDLAMQQAERADRELAAGHYRGPLHGIPWGAKDLIAWPGYPTTWGATPLKDQVIDTKATVAVRLEEAGAVLVAKMSMGALAEGDRWFGKMTRNPWNVHEGSSGSSAGSACATSAGLVGFALGTETLGSIVSPCGRCGVTGLRPTFGRVSRYGCMTLAWSFDKIGPIARSVEDCAIVFSAIHGFDGFDATVVDRPFDWPLRRDLRSLKVGYVEENTPAADRDELHVLKDLGVKLVPIKLPSKYPVNALTMILDTEAAAVFDEFARQGITDGLKRLAAEIPPGAIHARGGISPGQPHSDAGDARNGGGRVASRFVRGRPRFDAGQLDRTPDSGVAQWHAETRRSRYAHQSDIHRPVVRRNGLARRGPCLPARHRFSSCPAAIGESAGERPGLNFGRLGVVARLLLRGKLIARDGVQKRVDHLPLFGNTLPHDAFAQITGFF